MIELQNIGHCFGDKQVLEDVSMKIEAGEIVGLLGPSGAGKTTLIKILTGQLKQTCGEAYLFGEDTRKLSRKSYTKLGMVIDNAGLYERLSCYDNLLLFARLYRIPKERIFQILEKTGLLEGYFVKLFSGMYIGMAPLVSMAAIVSEEKEKNTLRVLLMSDVKAGEYLLGVGSYVFAACMAGSLLLARAGNFEGKAFWVFLAVMSIGIVISQFLGAGIGILCRTQMAAASITVPLMLVFSFLPMIGAFNGKVKQAAAFTYSGQLYDWMQYLENFSPKGKEIAYVGCNFVLAAAIFFVSYQRSLKRQ